MRKLRRSLGRNKGGRCGVIIPDGTLFGDGVCARIKLDLLSEFNLHTIIRLPKGVFAPYTTISTNILFFERNGPTKEIWYYEHPLPPERQKLRNPCYNKSNPLNFDEFIPLLDWWGSRSINRYTWKVGVTDIIKYDENGELASLNLDIKNPNLNEVDEYPPPEELLDVILINERNMLELISEIKKAMENEP